MAHRILILTVSIKGENFMTHDEAEAKLNIETDLVPRGRSNRPGTPLRPTHITIHNTDNSDPGADARAHAAYIKGPDARRRMVSWHYSVDDKRCVKHIPTGERAFHAPGGNSKSIGIEVCQNEGIDQDAAIERAALLAAVLMAAFDIPEENVVTHKFWTGKDCPHIILRRPGGFPAFRSKAAAFFNDMGEEAVGGGLDFGRLLGEEEDEDEESPSFSGDTFTLSAGSAERIAVLERLVGQLMVENQLLKSAARDAYEETLGAD